MKRLAVTIGLVAVLGAVGAGTASARTERQQDAAITALTAKLNCLVRYPVTQFIDYAWFGLEGTPGPYAPPANALPDFTTFDINNPNTYPFAPTGRALNNWGETTGLDFQYFGSPDTWLLGLKNTARCRGKFSRGANPHARISASIAAMRGLFH